MSIIPLFSPGTTSPESRAYFTQGVQSKDQQNTLQTALDASTIPVDTELT